MQKYSNLSENLFYDYHSIADTSYAMASMFENHALKVKNALPVVLHSNFLEESKSVIFLLTILFILWEFFINRTSYCRMVRATSNNTDFLFFLNNKSFYGFFALLPLATIFVIFFPYAILEFGHEVRFKFLAVISPVFAFAIILSSLLAFLGTKIGLIILCDKIIFPQMQITHLYIKNIFIFNFVFIFIFVIQYIILNLLSISYLYLWTSLIVIIFWFIFRAIRTTILLKTNSNYRNLQIILYLCTLEIAYPLFIGTFIGIFIY